MTRNRNNPKPMPSSRLRTPWRILLAILSIASGAACYVGFEVDRTIRHYHFSDFSPRRLHIGDILMILGVIYFLLVAISGRWRIIPRRH